ncbi:MAG: hypothetical protein NUV97_03885 [archaeon]|nr:hypothetical protein [archaeon]MCR4323841.1 hypothetical protein [Nanoarchaeota archaeon]
MKLKKILFLVSILGVLLLIAIAQNSGKTFKGEVSSISFSPDKITIRLENFKEKLIIFNEKDLDIKTGDPIEFSGKKEIYKNESQILIDKIVRYSMIE